MRTALDARLQAYERATGHQVIVWIGRTTGGEPIETWAARTFAAWRIGRRGIDDGVALFLMTEDRRSRLEVGYGLEPVITDLFAAAVLRDELAPRLAAGDWDRGIERTVDLLLAKIGGERGGTAARRSDERAQRTARWIGFGILTILFIALLIVNPSLALMMLAFFTGRRNGFGGGVGGGGFGGGGGRSGGGGASGSW